MSIWWRRKRIKTNQKAKKKKKIPAFKTAVFLKICFIITCFLCRAPDLYFLIYKEYIC
jgi:hypothetical protein